MANDLHLVPFRFASETSQEKETSIYRPALLEIARNWLGNRDGGHARNLLLSPFGKGALFFFFLLRLSFVSYYFWAGLPVCLALYFVVRCRGGQLPARGFRRHQRSAASQSK